MIDTSKMTASELADVQQARKDVLELQIAELEAKRIEADTNQHTAEQQSLLSMAQERKEKEYKEMFPEYKSRFPDGYKLS